MNWREARDLLDGKGKRRGPQDSLKIARNTVLERGKEFAPMRYHRDAAYSGAYASAGTGETYPDTAIGLRFHGTYVAILTPRWTELYTGGWPTRSTRDRIEYVSGIRVSARGDGWTVYLTRDGLPCYCERKRDRESDWIVIRGEHKPGMELRRTSEHNPLGKPVYQWETCSVCQGSAIRTGFDFESGGHPFYDGIRVSADGTRLMRMQPHRPRRAQRIVTESGFQMSGVQWRGY